jgi:hypothetical protein
VELRLLRQRREREAGDERPRLRERDDRAESGGERALLGGRQRVDELDRVAAEVEEAEDRAARLRHREGGGEGNERERHRNEQRPAAAPSARLEHEPELGRLRPLDVETAKLTLQFHTPPSLSAPGPSAT